MKRSKLVYLSCLLTSLACAPPPSSELSGPVSVSILGRGALQTGVFTRNGRRPAVAIVKAAGTSLSSVDLHFGNRDIHVPMRHLSKLDRFELWRDLPPSFNDGTGQQLAMHSLGDLLYFRLSGNSKGEPSVVVLIFRQSKVIFSYAVETAVWSYPAAVGRKAKHVEYAVEHEYAKHLLMSMPANR